VALGEHTGAASAYVGMTRGRNANTAHLVAESLDDARTQWVDTFSRGRADLGPAHAADLAAEEASKYASTPEPSPSPQDRLPRVGRPKPHVRYPSHSRDRGPRIGF
jgi:exodeoxyribonuclease V alpha subunit